MVSYWCGCGATSAKYPHNEPHIMGQVTVNDPDEHRTDSKVDAQGRVYIGSDYAGEKVNVVVEVIDRDE